MPRHRSVGAHLQEVGLVVRPLAQAPVALVVTRHGRRALIAVVFTRPINGCVIVRVITVDVPFAVIVAAVVTAVVAAVVAAVIVASVIVAPVVALVVTVDISLAVIVASIVASIIITVVRCEHLR